MTPMYRNAALLKIATQSSAIVASVEYDTRLAMGTCNLPTFQLGLENCICSPSSTSATTS
eukprot:scaffold649_cov347-Pavlova_lutheri.AAC.66